MRIRDLLQELEIHSMGAGAVQVELEGQSEATAGQPPRWTVKGKLMEGCEQLCFCVAAASVGMLAGFWWWALSPGLGNRDSIAGSTGKMVRISWRPLTSSVSTSNLDDLHSESSGCTSLLLANLM